MVQKLAKNVLFWALFFPILYTFSGFIILPWWLKNELPDVLKETYQLNLIVSEVRFNPFSFELHSSGIHLSDNTGKELVTCDALYLNYEPSYLFKKELFIRSIALEHPRVNIVLNPEGKLNLLALALPTEPTPQPSEPSSISALMVGNFHLQNGEVFFRDERGKEPFEMRFNPIDYVVDNFSLNKDDLSIHALKIALENEDKITLLSSATLDPLKFYGELSIKQLPLHNLWKYTLSSIPATLSSGELSLLVPFFIDLSKEKPQITLEKASAQFEKLRFIDTNKHTLIDAPSIRLESIYFDLQSSQINLEKAMITKPFINVEREKNNDLNLITLFTPKTTPSAHTESNSTSAWKVLLKATQIQEASVDFTDKTTNNALIHISPLNLTFNHLSNDKTATIAYELKSIIDETGALNLKGTFIPSSEALAVDITTQNLSLAKTQAYIEPFTTLSLQEGYLSSQTHLEGNLANTFTLKSELELSKLSLLDRFKNPIVVWDKLSLEGISFSSMPLALEIKKIGLSKPYVNLDIHKDKTTNFSNIIKPSSFKESPSSNQKLELLIGEVNLQQGSANFKDASLPIPFKTFINQLSGRLSTLDTKNSKPSVLKLEGKVDKYGYTKIEGSLLPFDFKSKATLKLLFKNIDMPSLTPYSGKFVGYAIKEGKLSMDLNYKIKKGLMEGDNKINLDSLTLGDKIESEEATNLPLGLAIAILKDSRGQIDLNLPVNGDLNDPEFRYASVVWKAFGNIIGGVLTSPFKLLGSLLGIEAENLKSIDFAAGESVIVASEEEKMEQYRQILEKRKELKLLITPSYNEEVDTSVLKEKNVTAQIETLIPKNSKETDSYGKAIKKLYIQNYSDEAYTKLLKQYKEENLDAGAINDNLIAKIAERIVIAPETLNELANARADAIFTTLIQKYKVPRERLIKNAPASSEAIRDKWVGCVISVSN